MSKTLKYASPPRSRAIRKQNIVHAITTPLPVILPFTHEGFNVGDYVGKAVVKPAAAMIVNSRSNMELYESR